jgi:hypothetical protein
VRAGVAAGAAKSLTKSSYASAASSSSRRCRSRSSRCRCLKRLWVWKPWSNARSLVLESCATRLGRAAAARPRASRAFTSGSLPSSAIFPLRPTAESTQNSTRSIAR